MMRCVCEGEVEMERKKADLTGDPWDYIFRVSGTYSFMPSTNNLPRSTLVLG